MPAERYKSCATACNLARYWSGRDDGGDRREGSDSSLAHLGWHARWLQRWVDLERQGLVREVQEMRVGADAGIGMLGSFVVVPAASALALLGMAGVAEGQTAKPSTTRTRRYTKETSETKSLRDTSWHG